MADQRSTHYNWFKGEGANGKKKSTKDSAKTVWKFTKLFLYFSLFFFSMWGCVQVFVVKTDTSVGRGVELYADQENIAPQVSSVHIDKDGTIKTGTQNGKDIYTDAFAIHGSGDNVYIAKKDNPDLFKAIQAAFVDQTHAGYTLDEANKGGNAVARIVLDGKEFNDQRGLIFTNGKPLVFTTEASHDVATGKTSAQDYLSGLHVYSWDETAKTVTAHAIDLSSATLIANDFETRAAEVFSLEYAKAILDLPGVKEFVAVQPTDLNGVQRYNKFISDLLGVAQVRSDKGLDAADVKFSLSHIAYGFASNKYTPMATWGQAWAAHRGTGPFYGIFVYPISWITNKILDSFPMMQGWESFLAIVIVVVVISLITFLLSFKGTLQQTKMQELNAKKAVIDAKYAPYKGNKQMETRQRQEVSEMYKKEGINPLSSLTTIFVTMPFFFAMWRVIGGIQHIKGTTWLGINFAATSYKELFAGHVQYLPLMVLAAGVQLFSQIYPRLLTRRRDKNRINVHQKAAMKKGNKMQNIMLVVFGFMALIFSAGLQVYFLIRSLWRLAEVQVTHHILVHQRKMRTRKVAA